MREIVGPICAVFMVAASVQSEAQVFGQEDTLDRTGTYQDAFHLDTDSGWAFTFTGELSLSYATSPDYTTFSGASRDGSDRVGINNVSWLIADFEEIGDPFWAEITYAGTYNWRRNLATGDINMSQRHGLDTDIPFAGLRLVAGTGNVYVSATNGPTLYGGPGNGNLGIYRRDLYLAGGVDTYWRANAARIRAQESVLEEGDLFNMARFISPDDGGTNGETYLGVGYVSDDRHYGVQVSDNAEWLSAWAAGRLVGNIGYGLQVVGVDSTNTRGRNVEDWAFDAYLGYSDARTEYALRFAGIGLGDSPVWGAEDEWRLGISSTTMIGDHQTLGGRIELSRGSQISPATGAYQRDFERASYQFAYSYSFDLHTRILANVSVTDTNITAGSFDGGSQLNTNVSLTLRWDY